MRLSARGSKLSNKTCMIWTFC